MRYAGLVIIIILGILACDKDATGPTDSDLIFDDSFEKNGQPNSEKWIVYSDTVLYSNDTPSGGGSWSLNLQPGWVPEVSYADASIQQQPGTGIYKLSVWVKCIDGEEPAIIEFGILSDDGYSEPKTIRIYSSEWAQVSITDTLALRQNDEIFISLSAGWAEVTAENILFDLIMLEKL